MALISSPRKLVIPLATGDEERSRPIPLPSIITKRVFYCGVVVEGSENGRRLPDEIQDLVLSLGNPLESDGTSEDMSKAGIELNDIDKAAQRKRALMDPAALEAVITELVTSERTYVQRLHILKQDYADPLRSFSRSKETAIIPAYEAKTLFGNIDHLLPVNEAFLTDLERMLAPNGARAVGGIGDVLLKHFKDSRGFELYKQYYAKREDAQAIFEKEHSKRSSRFASYIDHIKYQSTDVSNRIGLRELLMEPVQRIPRYTLLFRTILKRMSPDDPQRAKIIEADDIASRIAQAETDEETKRAAIFYCLISTIDGFPPDLSSNSRKFIDCIDVEDVVADAANTSAGGSSIPASVLHCSLFLFEDKLVIVKRYNGEKGCRVLTGLDSVEKVTKAGGLPTGKKKIGMSCKGVVDITEVVATDIGGADMNLFLENPPMDQTERWSGRPFRSLSVVNPPMPVNLDPRKSEANKQRFLENLWTAQAKYRARAGQSVVLCADDEEVDSRAGRKTVAKAYFNVYQRTAFLQEKQKTKVVVHIDRDKHSHADPLPFGLEGPPFVIIRIQLMDNSGLCRFSVRSNDPSDDGEEDIVKKTRVPSRIVQTIHQFGLFEFRTGRNSLPPTPTSRTKVAIFGLDALSRNLFNVRPGSSVGDFFAGSINGHRRNRSRSTASRSSMYTQTATTQDSSMTKSSHRSSSTRTAATTISTMDDESAYMSRSSKGPRKLSKRTKSRDGSPSDSEREHRSRNNSMSRSHSRSSSRASSRGPPEIDYSDGDDDTNTILAKAKNIGASDYHLAMQLELARQNSLNQHGKRVVPMDLDVPVEETIYEEEPPFPLRPSSRASRATNRTERAEPSGHQVESTRGTSRSLSTHSNERRSFGPRSPSPLPPQSPKYRRPLELPPMDSDDMDSEGSTHHRQSSSSSNHRASAIPKSTRQPFPSAYTEMTPRPLSNRASVVQSTPIVTPLSIKKKTSLRSPPGQSSNTHIRRSPMSKTMDRVVSPPRRVSPQIKKPKAVVAASMTTGTIDFEHLCELSNSTKEDIEMSRRSIKRIRLEADALKLPFPSSSDETSRPSSPEKRSSMPANAANKAAQERMDEMRNLIKHRQQGESTPVRLRTGSIFDTPSRSSSKQQDPSAFSRTVDVLVSEADKDLLKALKNQDILQADLARIAAEYKDRAVELERTRLELQNAKRQSELVKNLLQEAIAEKDIMYEAFNEELETMYEDAKLPDDEAWRALSDDLRKTKEARNNLSRENSALNRKYAELELEKEKWGDLLRANGLIS